MVDGVLGDLGKYTEVVQQHVKHVGHIVIRNRNTLEPDLVQTPTLEMEDVLAVDLLDNTRISVVILIFVKVYKIK